MMGEPTIRNPETRCRCGVDGNCVYCGVPFEQWGDFCAASDLGRRRSAFYREFAALMAGETIPGCSLAERGTSLRIR
jgi:hypothetical protein